MAAGDPPRKVKLLCGIGGRLVPRSGDGALRYSGTESRIIAVPRDCTFADFTAKMEEAHGASPVAVRYQLPDVGLDALVSVSSPDDLHNMMDEHDRLDGSSDGSAKLRVFLFNPSDLALDPLAAFHLADTGQQRYLDALNGVSAFDAVLWRKDSLVSAISTQNSDPSPENEGTLLSPTSHDPSLFFVAGSNHDNPSQYVNHQSLGVPMNVVVAPHSYVHGNPIQAKVVDTHMEENAVQTKVVDLSQVQYLNPNYKPFQPLSQLPPLHPSYLQPQNGELYGLRLVPPPPQGQALRSEDCYMCHKGLPHAHSDPVIQDGAVSGVVPMFQSLHLEDVTRMQAPSLVNGGLVDSPVEAKAESTVSAGHFGAYGFTQIPEMHHDNERLVPTNAGNSDHGRVLPSQGAVGLLRDPQAAYGMFLNPQSQDPLQQQQLPQSLGAPQFPIMQDAISQPYGNDVYPVKNGIAQAAEPLSRDSVVDSSYGFIQPFEGMTGSLHVNPFETSGFNEMWKPTVADDLGLTKELILENPSLVVEKSHAVKPLVDGSTMVIGNGYINHGLIPAGNYVTPIDQVQSSSMGFNQLHNLQPALQSQVSTSSSYLFNQEMGVAHRVPNEHLLGTPAYTCSINPVHAINTSTMIPAGNRKDEALLFHPDVLSDMTVPPGSIPPGSNISFPLPNSIAKVEQFQEPLLPDSLFCNQDPRDIMQSTNMLPPMPSWVTSKDSAVPKKSSMDNCLVNSKASDIDVLLEEGIFFQPPNTLNMAFYPEPSIGSRKGSAEEKIKQDLQAVAEGVAASVLQSSGPPVPLFVTRERMESASQSNKEREVFEDSASSQNVAALGDPRIEEIKTKYLDKMNPGFPIPDDIGRLQIIKNSDLEELRELGSGTFGTVYHGKWRGSDVAIKRINDRCFAGKPADQERMRTDFWNEACKLADLHHPNVVAFYGLVLDSPGGSVATVTEYMVNGSLRHVLQKNDNRTLDIRKLTVLAMDVAFGMEYLHDKNIVHFDLKSDNLLVNLRDPHRPICKVGDLGLSKVKCQTLISGGVRGTLPWMAPELLNGSSSMVSEKVDVFSFGIVMWELLTGEEPYADLHYGAIIGGIVNNTLRPPVPESCDPQWRTLMEKCWSSEPSERPSFTEIANSLRAISSS